MSEAELKELMEKLTPQLETLLKSTVEASLSDETLKSLIADQMKDMDLEADAEKMVALEKSVKELTEKMQMNTLWTKELKSEKAIELFEMAVIKSAKDKTSVEAELKTLTEGATGLGLDASGLYFIQTEFRKEIQKVFNDKFYATAYCRIMPMNSKTLEVPILVQNATNGAWVAEAASWDDGIPGGTEILLTAKKWTRLLNATSEMVEDFSADGTLWTMFAEAAAEQLMLFIDDQVFKGDGTGTGSTQNVLGVFNLTGAAVTTLSGAVSTMDYDDLIDMLYDIPVKYRRNVIFFFARDGIKGLRKLKDNDWLPIYAGPREAQPATLMGYPVVELAVGQDAVGDDEVFGAVGNLKHFAMGMRKNLTTEWGYIDSNFAKGIKSMKVETRFDAKAIFEDAFSLIKTAASSS